MSTLLFFGSALLGALLTAVLGRLPLTRGRLPLTRGRLPLAWAAARTAAWRYRGGVLAAIGLMLPVWCWWYLDGAVPAEAVALVAAGSFVGGVAATSAVTGLVEDNAPPSAGVREKVLTYHAPGDLPHPRQPALKRPFDIGVGLAALVATLPLWPVIAVLVWFCEPGPIFFTKNSVGLGGTTFRQLKFRSMRHGAERLTGPIASPVNDPRTLPVGRWLRRWHLDELPELCNVLTGRMSLVGPRPLRTVLVAAQLEENPGFAERHTVRPGIACIAQNAKYHISPAERLRKDRVYLRRMSVALDVRLLWNAVHSTLRGQRDRPTRRRSR